MHLTLILFFGAFLIVGVGMWINIVWGLVTGGPRAKMLPGQPCLYDRPYYLIWLLVITGWTIGLTCFWGATGEDASGFLFGWGLCAIGMALIFSTKRDMIMRGAEYLSSHGFVLWRFFHLMQVRQFDRMPAFVVRIMPLVFGVAGVATAVYGLFHWSEVVTQISAGAHMLLQMAPTKKPFA